MEKHFLGKVAAKALIAKGEEVLMVRDSGKDSAMWDLPGGKINVDESIEAGLRREIKEELGIDINVDSLICSEQVLHKGEGVKYLFITLRATLSNPNSSFDLQPEEIGEIKWFDKNALNEIKMYENCTRALEIYWGSK